jgi:hypothetical protein
MSYHLIQASLTRVAAGALLLFTAGCSLGGRPAPAPEPEPQTAELPAIRPEGKYVVVDLDVNELRFMHGDRVLWSAPVGTGTGFRLTGTKKQWEFSTPEGVFYVQHKEQNPTWYIPDWYFIENKLPIPPDESPRRKQPGGLGAAAVYLGHEIAIHGTDKPELLGKRVSHGCIRLSNANALRLFHNVQVGTPILITGGPEEVAQEQPDSVANFTRPKKRAPTRLYVNPFAKVGTQELLRRLDRRLQSGDTTWTLIASELLGRGLKDDATALRGLLTRAGGAGDPLRDAEFATYLADAFARGSLRTTVSLNRIDEDARNAAARAIVEATLALYHGPLDGPLAPWPTRRVPEGRLGPEGRQGWQAIAAAERAYREGRMGMRAAAGGSR